MNDDWKQIMKEQVAPFEMTESERQADAVLDEALSADAVAGDVAALEQRIIDATFEQLPTGEAVAGRIGRQTGRMRTGSGLSTAWRIAAVLALGMMTTLVVAVWQIEVPAPGVANAAVNTQNSQANLARHDRTQSVTTDAEEAFYVALAEPVDPMPTAATLDAELQLIGLQIELMLARDVFASPEESIEEAIETDLLLAPTDGTGLF